MSSVESEKSLIYLLDGLVKTSQSECVTKGMKFLYETTEIKALTYSFYDFTSIRSYRIFRKNF